MTNECVTSRSSRQTRTPRRVDMATEPDAGGDREESRRGRYRGRRVRATMRGGDDWTMGKDPGRRARVDSMGTRDGAEEGWRRAWEGEE